MARKKSPKNNPDAQEYELTRAGDLAPHPENPNNGDAEAIEESVDENGFFGACIVQRSTRRILIGNHRWAEHIKRRGEDAAIPVIWVDVDDARALAIMLADNATRQGAKTDLGILTGILKKLPTTRGTGYKPPQVDELLKAARPTLSYLDAMRAPGGDDADGDGEEPPFDAEDEGDGGEAPPPPSAPGLARHALAIVLTNDEKRIWDRLKAKVKKTKDKDAFLAMLSWVDVDG